VTFLGQCYMGNNHSPKSLNDPRITGLRQLNPEIDFEKQLMLQTYRYTCKDKL